MAELKTKQNTASVSAFLDAVDDKQKRADARKVAAIMRKATGSKARMWGTSIVGFGSYHYRYASGREGDWMITGFSPRKQALTLYIMPGFKRFDSLMNRLGTYKTGKSCLYIKRLEDIDLEVLQTLVNESVKHMRRTYDTER